MVTLATADNALKTVYLDVVSEQINTKGNPFLAKINKTADDVWGKDIRRVVHYGLNGGVGSGDEDGLLPICGENYYEQFVLSLKNFYGTIEISDKAIRASQNNTGAFVNLLNAEMEELIKAANFNFGRMLYGDGKGVLATVISNSSKHLKVDTVKNLFEGMILDIYNGKKERIAEHIRIISVDRQQNSVELNKHIPIDEKNLFLTMQNSYNKELTGLSAIFKDDETLYGLSRQTHKWLIPYMEKNVGEISETVIQKAIDEIEENSGNQINFIVCSYGVKRAFQKHLSSYKRNLDIIELNSGYKALSYNGIPIIADKFCPNGTMYLLNTNDFALHQLCDWQWLEGDDGRILKQIPGKPVYTATLVKYADLICAKPFGQGMLSGINEE